LDGVRYLVTARAATVAAATASALTVLSLVDLEGPAVEVAPIERLHGAGGIGVGHLHEAETARTTGFAIGYQETFSTVPYLEKSARTESSVALKGRLPTYSLVTTGYSV